MINKTRKPNLNSRRTRRGVTTAEIVVAAGIMAATMTFLTTLSFQTSRIWRDVSHQRVAIEELSNQLETLSLLDRDEVKNQIKNLDVSAITKRRLRNAKLVGVISEDNLGVRLELSLSWDRPVESKPLSLTGWLITGETNE